MIFTLVVVAANILPKPELCLKVNFLAKMGSH